MKSTVKFSKDSELQKKLAKFAQKYPQRMEQIANDATMSVVRRAKQNAPVETADLRNSISSEPIKQNGTYGGVIYTNLEYAPYVHFGTGIYAKNGGGRKSPWLYVGRDGKGYWTTGQEAQPFLADAIRDSRKEVINKLKELLN